MQAAAFLGHMQLGQSVTHTTAMIQSIQSLVEPYASCYMSIEERLLLHQTGPGMPNGMREFWSSASVPCPRLHGSTQATLRSIHLYCSEA